jgi:hypothetical protein
MVFYSKIKELFTVLGGDALKSSSHGAQYLTLQELFSHLSLVIYFFPIPPIELKLGLHTGGRLLVGSHLDQSL